MGKLSWDDAVASINCTTATSVMLNNLQPDAGMPPDQVKWVNILVRVYQGDKWFTHSQELNVIKERLLQRLEKMKNSDFIDKSKTEIKLPMEWRWDEEIQVTFALNNGEEFVPALEALMR